MGSLVSMAGAPPAPQVGPPTTAPVHPAPTPEGMALWAKLQKQLAKRQAKVGRAGKVAVKGPKSLPSNPEGTGSINDPAWQHLADLFKNGLPG